MCADGHLPKVREMIIDDHDCPPSGKAFAHGRVPNLREKALSCPWG
jgi:hypothetical protein